MPHYPPCILSRRLISLPRGVCFPAPHLPLSPGMPLPPPSVEPIDQRPQLRVAAAIALASALCLLSLQALTVDARQLPALLVIYVIHAALAGFVLVASFNGLGPRHGAGLGPLFAIGRRANPVLHLH